MSETQVKDSDANPLVSIIIPVYNGENFVEEAIRSALNQTYQNIEIILVNDGSTDNTEKICKKFSQIKYFYQENKGVAAALNKGIREAKGQYFSWLSHDDLYKNQKIEKQIEFINKQKNKELILWSNYEIIDETGQKCGETKFEMVFSPNYLLTPLFPIFNGLIHGCSLLIPFSLLKEFESEEGVFDERLRYTQDYDLWYRLFRKSPLYFLPEPLIISRQHSQQDSKKVKNFHECDELWIRMFKSLNPSEMLALSADHESLCLSLASLTKSAQYLSAYDYFKQKSLEFLEEEKVFNRKPLVSVIIPFHNRVDTTVEAVRSVLAQTEKDWELILVNDGSTADISEIEKIKETDPRIKLIELEMNQGASEARNHGIKISAGKFVAFLDSDDLWLPNKLQVQIGLMQKNNWKASHTSYLVQTATTSVTKVDSGQLRYDTRTAIRGCGIATPTVVLERKFLMNQQLLFNSRLRIGEDTCMWIDVTEKTNIYGIDQALSIVRRNSSTTVNNSLSMISGLSGIIKFCADKKYSYLVQDEINALVLALARINNPCQFQPNYSEYEIVAIRRYKKIKRYFDILFPPNTLRKKLIVRLIKKISVFVK